MAMLQRLILVAACGTCVASGTIFQRVQRMTKAVSRELGLVKDAEVEPQNLMVVGAGFGRTGTDSLREALRIIGYRSYHMEEAFKAFHGGAINEYMRGPMTDGAELADLLGSNGFNATVDWPMSLFYKQLLAHNASARVILTVRDSAEAWTESFRATIGSAIRVPGPRNMARAPFRFVAGFRDLTAMASEIYQRLGIEFGEDGAATVESSTRAYEAWRLEVERTVPPDQLLVFNAKQGWAPLCEFLDVADCPKVPYPRINSKEQMIQGFEFACRVADAFYPTVAVLAATIALVLARCR